MKRYERPLLFLIRLFTISPNISLPLLNLLKELHICFYEARPVASSLNSFKHTLKVISVFNESITLPEGSLLYRRLKVSIESTRPKSGPILLLELWYQ